MMRTCACVAAVALCLLAAGCVEREMTLVTDPPGAIASYNGREIGRTPVTFHFTYYQPADLRFERDGCRPLRVTQKVKEPLWQCFPFDFFAETSPFTFHDRQTFTYKLAPAEKPDVNALLQRSDELRKEIAPAR